jgi:hypothetical protein
LVAKESNATNRPSAEIVARSLNRSPCPPSVETDYSRGRSGDAVVDEDVTHCIRIAGDEIGRI